MMISDPDFQVNEKFQTAYRSVNHSRYIFTTNNINALNISQTDRRFVIFECSNERQQDTEHFKKLDNLIRSDAQIRALFQFFKDREIKSDIDFDRPKTAVYNLIKESNKPPIERWLSEYCADHVDDDEPSACLSMNELFQIFGGWLSNANCSYDITKNKFTRSMKLFYDGKFQTKKAGISLNRTTSHIDYIDIKYAILLESLNNS